MVIMYHRVGEEWLFRSIILETMEVCFPYEKKKLYFLEDIERSGI
jgi:hypothetical protein